MSETRLYESVIQPLTAENLQILQEQYKSIKKTSTTARIIKWLSEIPQNLGSADNMSTSNDRKEGSEYQSQNINNKGTDNLDSQPQQRSLEKINKENSHQSFNEYNKKNESNNDYDRMKKMNTPSTANNATEKRSSRDKGRLCCYLKVEIGGNTQLLPIHEYDIPQNLAYNFCKSNNILNSVNSLKEHIINAIENYTSNSSEISMPKRKSKLKSKTKINRNENHSKTKFNKNENINKINTNKLTKSNENIMKNRTKSKTKTSKKVQADKNLKSNENLKKKVNTKYLKSTNRSQKLYQL